MKNITKSVRYALIAATLVAAGAFTAASKPDFALGRNIQTLFNMFRDASAFYVDSVDTDEMLRDAAAGMTSNLDPYTVLIPEDEMEEFEILTTGKYGGIGALVRQSGDWIAIAQPYEGFPADKAGLVIGDKLLEVDGRSIRCLDVSEVSSMLKGSPGTALRLKVEKLLTGEQADVTLRRERIKISGIPYYGMIADGVGYILHDDFTEECSLDMRRALVELMKLGATSLIIDLRGNGGGILQEAVKILSLLVPKGTDVESMKGRIGELADRLGVLLGIELNAILVLDGNEDLDGTQAVEANLLERGLGLHLDIVKAGGLADNVANAFEGLLICHGSSPLFVPPGAFSFPMCNYFQRSR